MCGRIKNLGSYFKVHYYRPKRSFGQGNVFTCVCDSVNRGGVCLEGGVPPIFFLGGVCLKGGFLQIFGGGGGGGVCLEGGFLQIFAGGGVLPRNTVNVRPVRILLECILVVNKVIRYKLRASITHTKGKKEKSQVLFDTFSIPIS